MIALNIKISQFADDTSLFLDGTEASLNATLDLLNDFALYSGLKINYDKTHLTWIGSEKYSTKSIKTKYKQVLATTQFKVLGILFDVDLNRIIDINFTKNY